MSGASDLKLETLRIEQDGRVLVARVDDPPYNFMTARMQRDLDALTRAVDDDLSVGAVILTGDTPDRYIMRAGAAVVDASDGADIVDTLDGLRPRSATSTAASAAH